MCSLGVHPPTVFSNPTDMTVFLPKNVLWALLTRIQRVELRIEGKLNCGISAAMSDVDAPAILQYRIQEYRHMKCSGLDRC